MSKKLVRLSLRRSTGFSLVETLVGITIFAIVAVATTGQLGACLRLTTGGQNYTVATQIVQQSFDNLRSISYSTLSGYVPSSPFTLVVLDSTGSATYPAVAPRPLQFNLSQVNLSTYDKDLASMTATETLTSTSGGILATVSVTWKDSTGNHTLAPSIFISQYGIHN